MKCVENCEGMTSSTRSFEYSWGLVKKCFPKKFEISKCHNFLISYPIFIIFVPYCRGKFSLSFEIVIILARTSPLKQTKNNTETNHKWHLYCITIKSNQLAFSYQNLDKIELHLWIPKIWLICWENLLLYDT